MTRIVVLGAGQIGCCVAYLLDFIGDYEVFLADKYFSDFSKNVLKKSSVKDNIIDVSDESATYDFCHSVKADAICCCLPFNYSLHVAKVAYNLGINYFDLTEDIVSSKAIRALNYKPNQVMISQCGLAPGLVNMLVNNYAKDFSFLDSVELRVGALPKKSNLPLHHALLWSVDGLVNEYIKPAEHLVDGKVDIIKGLSNLKNVTIKDKPFEIFATSGGVGSLVSILQNKSKNIEYRTIRHRGHCNKMLFLLDELGLRSDLKTLKRLLINSMPYVTEDQVIIDFFLKGQNLSGANHKEHITKTYFNLDIGDFNWRAIQWTTAASMCVVLDLAFAGYFITPNDFYQDKINLKDFYSNRFGRFFDS